MIWRCREAVRVRRPLSDKAVETIFELESQAETIRQWATLHEVRTVVIADFSKNLFATFDGCRRAGLQVKAIADAHPAFAGLKYRGMPIVSDAAALACAPHGIVISNVNPAQIDGVVRRFEGGFTGPILRLWHPVTMERLRQAA
jgi:hypothetical protein